MENIRANIYQIIKNIKAKNKILMKKIKAKRLIHDGGELAVVYNFYRLYHSPTSLFPLKSIPLIEVKPAVFLYSATPSSANSFTKK